MAVFFTGHRTINGLYAPGGLWGAVLSTVTQVITTLYHKYNQDTYVAGGALGFDTTAACAVLNLKQAGMPLKLILGLPFKGFEAKWIPESKMVLELMIPLADEVHYVCDPGYSAWKMMARNKWMVDYPGVKTGVALYLPDKVGGTLNCIGYAMKQKKSLITIHPITQVIEGIVFNHDTNEYLSVPV